MFIKSFYKLLSIILATILFGVLDSFWRPLILDNGHLKVLLHRTILTVLIFILFKIAISEPFVWNYNMIFLTVLSGIIATVGLYSLTKAFQLINTSTVVFLNIFTLLFGQLFSFIFFGETLEVDLYSIELILSIFTILLLNQGSFKLSKGIKFGLVASFCFGLAYPLMGIPIKVLGSFNSSFIQEIVVLMGVTLMSAINKETSLDFSFFKSPLLILLSLFTVVALILHFNSYESYPVYKINMISNFYPVVALISSVLLYKEKIGLIQFFGALLAMITTIVIITF